MNESDIVAKTRLSRIVLIDETSTLVFNDWLTIKFLRRKAFVLAWVVCRAMAKHPEFQSLGGIPPSELLQLCHLEGLNISQNAMNTLWHDEVEFRRHHKMAFSMFEVTYLKDGVMPPQITPSFIASILQLIFGKARPPISRGLHHNVRLFTVKAEPEQILIYRTSEEGVPDGIQPWGLSDITKFRKRHSEIGFISWEHKIKVDEGGSSDSIVAVKLVNLSPVPLLQHMLPIWSDTPQQAKGRALKAWFANGMELTVETLVGKKGKKKIVEFIIMFPHRILLGQTIEFCFSYHTEKAYSAGRKEYFTWYFDHPHTEYTVDLQFSDSWLIREPIVFQDDKDEDLFQAELLSPTHIRWTRFFPTVGCRYQIYFQLSLADK